MQDQDMPDPGRVLGETQQCVLCMLLAMNGSLCSMHELAVAVGDQEAAELAVVGLHAEGLVHRQNPVYVMHQMGHTDPKLALRIYTKVMGEQRRRGPGARLVSVLDGARWTETTPEPRLMRMRPKGSR